MGPNLSTLELPLNVFYTHTSAKIICYKSSKMIVIDPLRTFLSSGHVSQVINTFSFHLFYSSFTYSCEWVVQDSTTENEFVSHCFLVQFSLHTDYLYFPDLYFVSLVCKTQTTNARAYYH